MSVPGDLVPGDLVPGDFCARGFRAGPSGVAGRVGLPRNDRITCGGMMKDQTSDKGWPDDWDRGGYVPGEQYTGEQYHGAGASGSSRPGSGMPGQGGSGY